MNTVSRVARTVPILFACDIDQASRFYAELGLTVAVPAYVRIGARRG